MSLQAADVTSLSWFRRRGRTVGFTGVLVVDARHSVLHASNGAEALDVLRTVDHPLVVLLDWMMPIMDGLDVLRTVEREPAHVGRHAKPTCLYVHVSGVSSGIEAGGCALDDRADHRPYQTVHQCAVARAGRGGCCAHRTRRAQ